MELDVSKTRVAIQPTKALAGETSAVSKTVDGRKVVRGFESLPLRLEAGILSLVFWGLDQAFGSLTSGQATDPNSGPVLALMAIAVMGTGTAPVSRRAVRRTGSRTAGPAAGTSPPLVPRSAS